MNPPNRPKALLFANTSWYLFNFRRSLAERLRLEGWDVVLVAPPDEHAEELRSLGFRFLPVAFPGGRLNPVAELFTLTRLVRLYRSERPTVAHHFTLKCVLYGTIAARLAGGTSIVNAVTGLGYVFSGSDLRSRAWRSLLRPLLRLSLRTSHMRVVFQNREDQSFFTREGFVPESLTCLIRGSGIDCQRFTPSDTGASGGRRTSPRVLFASRLLRDKGVYELLQAARLLRKRGVDATFTLAGSTYGGNPSSLQPDEVEKIRREGLVECLGHVEEMPKLLAESDIVVLPSYHEGTPRILLEAAASGRAIVATDIPGCRGIVDHGVNGLLVPVRDAASLARAIELLLKQPELRESFGRKGREIAVNAFDERLVLDRTIEVYRELVSSSSARAEPTVGLASSRHGFRRRPTHC